MNDIESADQPEPIIQQLDQVELITTRRVSYMSDKPGSAPSPHGVWSVVGLVAGQALLAKEGALIRIPLGDIRKVSSYSVSSVMEQLRKVGNDRIKRIADGHKDSQEETGEEIGEEDAKEKEGGEGGEG